MCPRQNPDNKQPQGRKTTRRHATLPQDTSQHGTLERLVLPTTAGMHLHDPATELLCIYASETKVHVHTENYMKAITVALLINPKQKQPTILQRAKE